jgi:integrase
LRSSDIVNLKFENIDWDNNIISLTQVKTREIITLPLLNDVGNAIIDYVQHGRPNQSTKLKYVFVSQDLPYRKINTISFIVKNAIIKSGIDARGRHRGSHSLRHSLATKLMNNGAQLPTIKEVLGHKSIESSSYYLDVNLNSLLECSHDVPLVDADFYNNLKPYML